MGKKRKNGIQMAFGLLNVKRCLTCAVLSVALFPVLLLIRLLEPENVFLETSLIPVTFFSAFSGAFGYLLYQVARQKTAAYYELVMWLYAAFFQLYLSYLAGLSGNVMLYYAAVVIGAYLLYLDTVQYIVLAMMELLGCMWFIMASGTMLSPSGICILTGVHLFAFFVSRENYNVRKEHIIEEHKLKKEMNEAERDPLTGLINRRGLDRRVGEVWAKCVARKETLGVFVIDIDHFKKYNDRYGHVQGDACICKVAKSISGTVGKAGLVSRIGGEEFLVFVRDMSEKEIHELAEAVRAGVQAMAIPSPDSVVTISLGMDVAVAEEELTLQGLYGRADRQLYVAKNEGRNCVRSTHTKRRYSRIGKVV